MNLALEEVETGMATDNAAAEKKNEIVKHGGIKSHRNNRGSLPAHLPCEEIVIEPED